MTLNEIYLELLRAGLWDRPAVVSGSVSIAGLMSMAGNQTTVPLVGKALLDRYGDKLSNTFRASLDSAIERCAKSHAAANAVIGMVCRDMAEAGADVVLLKGQGIASWYPIPELRQAGDIDLYARDYDKAHEVISRLFEKTDDGSKHSTWHVGGNLDIELHRYTETLHSARKNAIYQKISDEGTSSNLTSVTIDGTEVMTPEDSFNAFYIFHHLWHHVSAMGMGMRQFCDLGVFLRTHRGTLDSDRLEGWLRSLGLLDVWQVFGCALVSALQLEPEEIPLYNARKAKRGERLVEFMLLQGNNMEFKHGRKDEAELKHKAGSLRFVHRRLALMFPIFPAKAVAHYLRDIANGIRKLF